jgi:hypothetical protein
MNDRVIKNINPLSVSLNKKGQMTTASKKKY